MPGVRTALKRLLPASFLTGVRQLRGTETRGWPWLLRGWVASLWNDAPRLRPLPQGARVLFVCYGNIIRSPAAAALFERMRPDDLGLVASAGLHAVDGLPADPRALEVAPEFGITLAEHRSRRLTLEVAARLHLIVVMDARNEAELRARFPAIGAQVVRLGRFHPSRAERGDIADPYMGGLEEVRASYRRIAASVGGLAAAIRVDHSASSHPLP